MSWVLSSEYRDTDMFYPVYYWDVGDRRVFLYKYTDHWSGDFNRIEKWECGGMTEDTTWEEVIPDECKTLEEKQAYALLMWRMR